MKKKRNYGAEKSEAMRYADGLHALNGLWREEWLERWPIAFNGYLAGMRRKARRASPKRSTAAK